METASFTKECKEFQHAVNKHQAIPHFRYRKGMPLRMEALCQSAFRNTAVESKLSSVHNMSSHKHADNPQATVPN